MAEKAQKDSDFETAPNKILLELVDHLDAMLAYWDKNQVCGFANNAYRSWFGKSREEVIGMTMEQLLGPLYPKNLPYIRAALAGQRQVFERAIPTPDGNIRDSLATYTPHIVNGEVCGFFVHVADVTPLKQLEQQLRNAKAAAEQQATHDFLTGLPNRVLLVDRITQAIAHGKRTKRFVAAISVDVDDFKKINDTYGHAAGDRLLIEIALRLKGTLRAFDSVTRMGGDEFLLLISEVESKIQIEAMAARILKTVNVPFEYNGATISPGCSLGIAICPPECATAQGLISESDRALYHAKRLGKNRYAFSEVEEDK